MRTRKRDRHLERGDGGDGASRDSVPRDSVPREYAARGTAAEHPTRSAGNKQSEENAVAGAHSDLGANAEDRGDRAVDTPGGVNGATRSDDGGGSLWAPDEEDVEASDNGSTKPGARARRSVLERPSASGGRGSGKTDASHVDRAAEECTIGGMVRAVSAHVGALTESDFHGMSQGQAADLVAELERTERQLAAVKSRAAAAIEADGLWATSGARSFAMWWRAQTGRRAGTARSMVRTARTLRDELPWAQRALANGRVGQDHVELLSRHAVTTTRLRQQLADDALGERFLVAQAQRMDADSFAKVVKAWAIRADPEAADRAWRDQGSKEELFCSPVLDGYAVNGWLNVEHGQALEAALRAVVGVPAAEDTRSPATRRAGALVHLARRALDSGELQPGARQRPHLGVHVDFSTLEALIAANAPTWPTDTPSERTPLGVRCPASDAAKGEGVETSRTFISRASGLGAQGRGDGTGGGEGLGAEAFGSEGLDAETGGNEAGPTMRNSGTDIIDPALDDNCMRGVRPATWSDGTPIPPAQLAKLACSGGFHRVIFGPEGQILDSGREERLFTPAQTRAVIARDRNCQFPDCDAPPGEGEIHHSIWWFAQGGATSVDNGVLLCWAHHDFVHQRNIVIGRQGENWVFERPDGREMRPTLPPGERPPP